MTRERQRESNLKGNHTLRGMVTGVCVCESERERERETSEKRDGETEALASAA